VGVEEVFSCFAGGGSDWGVQGADAEACDEACLSPARQRGRGPGGGGAEGQRVTVLAPARGRSQHACSHAAVHTHGPEHAKAARAHAHAHAVEKKGLGLHVERTKDGPGRAALHGPRLSRGSLPGAAGVGDRGGGLGRLRGDSKEAAASLPHGTATATATAVLKNAVLHAVHAVPPAVEILAEQAAGGRGDVLGTSAVKGSSVGCPHHHALLLRRHVHGTMRPPKGSAARGVVQPVRAVLVAHDVCAQGLGREVKNVGSGARGGGDTDGAGRVGCQRDTRLSRCLLPPKPLDPFSIPPEAAAASAVSSQPGSADALRHNLFLFGVRTRAVPRTHLHSTLCVCGTRLHTLCACRWPVRRFCSGFHSRNSSSAPSALCARGPAGGTAEEQAEGRRGARGRQGAKMDVHVTEHSACDRAFLMLHASLHAPSVSVCVCVHSLLCV